jgi:hypothetical protein
MQVVAFKTVCLNCNNIFACPKLSDFSYGDIIYTCECGKEFLYHCMVSHPVSTIFELFCHIYKIDEHSNSLINFSAFFADTVHFHRLCVNKICPNCKSVNLSIDENKKMGVWTIQTASYDKLYSLSKEKLLKEFEKYLLA